MCKRTEAIVSKWIFSRIKIVPKIGIAAVHAAQNLITKLGKKYQYFRNSVKFILKASSRICYATVFINF